MSGFGNSGFGNSGFGAPVPSSYGAPNYGGGGGSFPSSNSSPSPYVQQPPFGGVVSTPSYTTTNTGGFGTATPATPAYSTGFGSQQQQQPPQPSGMMFGSSPNVAIGASVHSITFGQPTLTSTHFGSNTTPSGGFGGFGTTSSSGGFRGNSNTSNNSATLHSAAGGFGAPQFGGPANVDFGTSPSTQQTSSGYPQPSFGGPAYASLATPSADPMNPFLSAPQQQQQPDFAQSMSFGRSSNVVTTNDTFTSQSGFGPGFGSGAATRGPFDNSIMPQASSVQASTPPFGMSAQDDPFDDGMTDEVPSSTLPFGQPVTAFATSSTAQLTSHSTLNSRGFFDTGATLSTQEEDRANDRLAMLNARIAAKKKKFEEEKRKRGTAMQGAVAASALRAEAASFEPLSSVAPFEPSSHNGASTMEPSSVAQRNAMRFSESKDTVTRSQLPADLLLQSAEVTAAQTLLRNSGGRSGRENLENAVSLVGICQYMCPDEELLRREREGDIQLLERPVPDGILHPTHWTLRDTMVKRFRRSAADYKLDVPEWVRPPDVLERVCSYLEEWVMVGAWLLQRLFLCP